MKAHTVRSVLSSLQDRLPMFVIYDHPADYPDQYVARLWFCLPYPRPLNLLVRSTELDDLRALLTEAGLIKAHRSHDDDSVIIESWI